MDLICPKCCEPWDLDSFEDNELDVPADRAVAIFQQRGCGPVFDNDECAKGTVDPHTAMVAAAVYDMLGDDPDGCAAEFEALGL
jgi:hypothetical protein